MQRWDHLGKKCYVRLARDELEQRRTIEDVLVYPGKLDIGFIRVGNSHDVHYSIADGLGHGMSQEVLHDDWCSVAIFWLRAFQIVECCITDMIKRRWWGSNNICRPAVNQAL